MKSSKKNTFSRALHHLKSTQIDEKLKILNEMPTSNTSGIYVVEPEYQVQDPDVPGDVTREVDFTQDALANGRDTTGLFDDDGTILTIEPPGDTSYILGPMASMWYAWGNFSTIGYIRQSDRRMVDLGRITGRLGSWNGTSNFTSYGQLTLEQAVWFRDTPKLNGDDNNTPNYRAFYPGPPSNSPDQYGRYLCVITGTPKPVGYKPPERRIPPTMGGFDPNLPPGSAKPKKKDDLSPRDLYDLGLYRGADGKLHPLPTNKGKTDYDAADPLNLAFNYVLARLGLGAAVAFRNWANKGKNQRISDEDVANWGRLWADDQAQKGQSDAAFARGDKPGFFGRPDQAFNPFRPAEKGGPGSGPTPIIRQGFRRATPPGMAAAGQSRGSKTQKNSFNPQGQILSESRQRIIRNIKQPLVIPEAKKEKIKHRPKVIGSPSKTINADLMKKAEVPSSFKSMEEKVWRKMEKEQNARLSQERKNEVLDHLGGSNHAWEYVTETGRIRNENVINAHFGNKKEKLKVIRKEELKGDALVLLVDDKNSEEILLQSELSIRLADKFNKELFEKYYEDEENSVAHKDPLFARVRKKLKPVIDYPDKPSKSGNPDQPPPEQVDGWHPNYGKSAVDMYKRLDPISASSMPPTGNPEIDQKVEKAKRQKK